MADALIIVRCPKCNSEEVRLHGILNRMSFHSGFWTANMKAKISPSAYECSCGSCFYAFVVREGMCSPAPVQTAYDRLKEMGKSIEEAQSLVQGKGRSRSDDEPQAPLKLARPAPDPRPRRRGV